MKDYVMKMHWIHISIAYKDANNNKVVESHQFVESGGRKRVGHKMTFTNNIIAEAKKYRKPYKGLTTLERKRRIVTYTKDILAGCVDRLLLDDMGHNYFVGNDELALEALDLLDGIRNQLQWELKVNLKEVERQKLGMIEGKDEAPLPQIAFKTAVALLGETTANGFKRLRDKIIEDFSMTNITLPSFYQMTSNRPSIIPISFGSKVSVSNSDHNASPQETIVKSEALNNVDERIDYNVKIAKEAVEKIDVDSALKSIKKIQ